ncbi:TPA: very short patch repair endonuclease [Neisseria meningitidis]|uniref:Type II nicking enzyme V.NmeDIP n=5 Tax=Neisseria meningitidis TaxID=487 RepID=VSN1_NEIMC|nr:very short patch repair endonuclease [Neisseria meningitidis]Q9RLM5.1 RecName: Full=Type II nicking enzyme V.NmeDIP; Short=V.NmeDIP; AltName: Full=NmeDIP very short patch repair endonuclease [Neisseria meningitidis serogroup C]EGC64417.1 Very short patch repair protein [Neisseria meningitidis 961-5945]ADY93401.1 Very short patch repair protein [Neisseria meningitidis G2136]AIZ17543.1 restriction endonuclease HpaII [Neisseria meningitidis]AIZ20145.1 restriction endonuclease HpaII [Neisseria 
MDRLTPEQRKKCMQSNKSKGTKPELALAKAMWALGLRYRKNSGSIFGKPDFSFKKYKVAVFVDGEFWHGKDWEQRKAEIKGNREFWIAKIERNIRRDMEVTGRLKVEGWAVLRFWSNDVVKNTTCCAEKVRQAVRDKQGLSKFQTREK